MRLLATDISVRHHVPITLSHNLLDCPVRGLKDRFQTTLGVLRIRISTALSPSFSQQEFDFLDRADGLVRTSGWQVRFLIHLLGRLHPTETPWFSLCSLSSM